MMETLVFPQHTTYAEFLGAVESPQGQNILHQLEANFSSIADLNRHTFATGHGALVHIPGENILFEHLSAPKLIGFAHHLVHDGIAL